MESMFKKIQAASEQSLFMEQIEDLIISGRLPVGAKLPAERELSEQMNVSRANVATGIAELEARGFLEVRPRKGVFVADYKTKGKLDVLSCIMRYDGYSFKNGMGASLLRVRTDIETSVAELAALSRMDADLVALSDCLDAMAETNDPEELAEISFDFHHKLCIASGNQVYPILFYSFKTVTCSVLTHMYRSCDKVPRIDEHRRVLEAVRRMDAGGAKTAMNDYLDREYAAIRASL